MVSNNMKKRLIKVSAFFVVFLLMISYVSYNSSIIKGIDEISVYGNENVKEEVNDVLNVQFVTADVEDDTAVLKLFGIIPIKKVNVNKISTDSICLGGNAFGIKMFTKGVIVVGLTHIITPAGALCPAREAGIEKGDIILAVNGVEVTSAEDFGAKISKCGSKGAVLHCIRGNSEFDATVLPAVSSEDNKYKVGLWVRDSTAGIGTVTFVDKKTGIFGGLGQGVCDVDTGLLMPLDSGTVVDVEVTGAVKGEPHSPGELRGNFGREIIGEISSNDETGVYGKLSNAENVKGEVVKIGTKNTVTEGKVYIYTTILGNSPKKYEAEIVKIFEESGKTKNFMIKVTDKELLDSAGGIVQGMSGSPVLQNGKLIGAVTHVLINDPKKGYGIFIENMLETANDVLKDQNNNQISTKKAA